eukprot:Seg7933.2 transcript_id=Seg7933.2/GoldUCD/mRNA.D3Y31 product="Glutathione gamma-glutamylcysteinyltransferase" protein_id=Seg7933.2/GoldUCD/D3Y31
MADLGHIPSRGESWYNAQLPKGMVKFESEKGKKMLEKCKIKSLAVIKQFVKQRHRTFCGPCSLAIVANTLGLAKTILGQSQTEARINEDDIAEHQNVKSLVEEIEVKSRGVTLDGLRLIAQHLNFNVHGFYIANKSRKEAISNLGLLENKDLKLCESVDQFRAIVSSSLINNKMIVLNYRMGTLGYRDLGGHFSPVGAYSDVDDMLLVLDTWPETPPAWVKTTDIFDAMATVDNDSKQNRGFLIFES